MSPSKRRAAAITPRSVLLAVLLSTAPIGIVWFGAKEAEGRIAAGDSDGAERMLAVFGALSTYPLLPRLAEARVHGVRCELAARKGLDSDAMDHFVKELSILTGQDLMTEATDGEEGQESVASLLRFRKGVEHWSRGYAGWIGSSPESMPDFDHDFLAPVLPLTEPVPIPEPAPSSVNAEPIVKNRVYVEELHVIFDRAMDGKGIEEIPAFLVRYASELELARHWTGNSNSTDGGPEQVDEASTHFRILLLDFLNSCQTHKVVEALASLGRCGEMLRQIEGEPSLGALFVNYRLRSHWLATLEKLMERTSVSSSTRQGLVRALTLYCSDPEFPVLCIRRNYASYRKFHFDAYLDGKWETASPAGRRLFVRQLELAFNRHEALVEALSPSADPEASGKTFSALQEAGNLSPKILDLRRRISKAFYGSGALTEADGRSYAEAIDEWVVHLNDSIAITRLGRLDDSLRELYEVEERLIGRLKSEP